ncbi:unnamed protein product [Dibothriocephalus latus]|uniref:Uncharacterized protein n=1 Tax=Dibothriocephalus latus TaxID=60516 RepID=A0A3P6PKU7_DIBLA|nr:unnamed protein product [Dibothriocephalus latus]
MFTTSVLQGCECWAMRMEEERKLEVYEHYCSRAIVRGKYTRLASNGTVCTR